MKLLNIYLASIVSSAEKKVPPRHPLQRLKRLGEFSEEILTSEILQSFVNNSNIERSEKWIKKWTDRWIRKFSRNADRMEWSFTRVNRLKPEEPLCGFYDSSIMHGGPDNNRQRRDLERYDREDPCKGIKQIITGFSKWSDRYISSCPGQKNRQWQKKRMIKWEEDLNKGQDLTEFIRVKFYNLSLECLFYLLKVLGCSFDEQNIEEPVTTTAGTTIANPTTTTTAKSDTYFLVIEEGFSPVGMTAWWGRTIEVSYLCSPNYVDSFNRNCKQLSKYCENVPNSTFNAKHFPSYLAYATQNRYGYWQTLLNCPECGCGEDGAMKLYNINA